MADEPEYDSREYWIDQWSKAIQITIGEEHCRAIAEAKLTDVTRERDNAMRTGQVLAQAVVDAEAKVAALSAVMDAAENFVKVKGRHNSEIAMRRLMEAVSAAQESAR